MTFGVSVNGHASMEKRILVARLVHKTNTFVSGRTSLEDFEIRRGREMIRYEGEVDPFAGALEVAQHKGWEVLLALDFSAPPGATVADAVVDLFWAEFRAVIDKEGTSGIDGVFLMLHGAMVSESLEDVEGEILRRIRGIEHLSDIPVCGAMDPYANFTEAMARQSDGLVAHRGNPLEDTREATILAATILDGLMQTENRPATVWDHPPIMWPPSGAATDQEPMLTLETRAREIEAELPDVLAVNVLAGFPYADVPEAGVNVSAMTNGDLELAHGALRELNVIASSLREAGTPSLLSLEQAMVRLEYENEGPILLVEPSDNVGAGAAGDSTYVLRALVEHGVPDSGVMINDPETVANLADATPGDIRSVEIGGKSGDTGSDPLPLEVEVVSSSDGQFMTEGSSTFPSVEAVGMGDCVVVRHGGVTVLLTSHRTVPFDLDQWRSQGVEPEDLLVIGVKAATEHETAYGPIAAASYALDLPGPCAENLRRLPLENVARPIYPLDEM